MKREDIKKSIMLSIKNKIPVILYGPPGTGKNYLLREIALEKKMEYIVVEAASLLPEDVNGIPYIDGNKTRTTPSWIMDLLKKENKILLVFDEIFSAKMEVQAALHGVFHNEERRIGSFPLPENVYIAATSNIEGDHISGFDRALLNRALVLEISKVYLPGDLHPVIKNFLETYPQYIWKISSEEYYQYPTLRTWSMLSKVLEEKPELSVVEVLAKGFLGDDSLTEKFIEHYRMRLSEEPDIYKNPYGWFLYKMENEVDDIEKIFQILLKKVPDSLASILPKILESNNKETRTKIYKLLSSNKEINKELMSILKTHTGI